MKINNEIILEELGYFYTDKNQETKLPGNIKIFNNGKINLDIIGSFNNNSGECPQIIKGELKTKKIILFKVDEDYLASFFDRYTNYNVEYAFINSYSQDEINDDFLFNEVIIEFSNLKDWLNPANNLDFETINENNKNKTKIIYKIPETETYKINDLEISFCYKFNGITESSHLKQKVYIKIKTEKKKKFDELLSIISHLKYLLVLLINMPVRTKKILMITSENKEIELFGHFDYYPNFESSGNNNKIISVNYKAIKNNFKTIIENWFNQKEKYLLSLLPTIKLYYFDIFRPAMITDILRSMEGFYFHFVNKKQKTLYSIIEYFYNEVQDVIDINNINNQYLETIKEMRRDIGHLKKMGDNIINNNIHSSITKYELIKIILLLNVYKELRIGLKTDQIKKDQHALSHLKKKIEIEKNNAPDKIKNPQIK